MDDHASASRATASDPIERLRAKRGDEQVSFANVADHMRDYVDRHPLDTAVVLRLADFFAAVEDVSHDHDADPLRGLG